jgi:hypothetical protein
MLQGISELTSEQLNTIPEGFNNNIIWNLGHMLAASQALCYRRSGLPVTIPDQYVTPFLTGTKPDDFINDKEIEIIKGLLISTPDRMQQDLAANQFVQYTKSERIEEVFDIALNTVEDAIAFMLYHEGMHSGYIERIKRLV